MAWTYYCEPDKVVLRADTKEELAEQLLHHARMSHQMEMTMADARASVEKHAKQEAA